jgi:hypothetical protein
MQPDPTNLLNLLDISNPLIGFYDTLEKGPFEPSGRKQLFIQIVLAQCKTIP